MADTMFPPAIAEKARKSMSISGRYDREPHPHRDWTPAQKRRMRKKFRKHGIQIPPFAMKTMSGLK